MWGGGGEERQHRYENTVDVSFDQDKTQKSRYTTGNVSPKIENFNPISAGGGGEIHPLTGFPSPRHKYQPIDSKLSDFYISLSRHNLTENQVYNLSRGHVITLLSEALCFTTYLSLYLHRIFKVYFFIFLTFIFGVN